MASVERHLITKILRTRDLTEVADMGITPKFFLDSDSRNAFKMILGHQSKYSIVPTIETFQRDYPTYKLTDSLEPIAFYIDQIKLAYVNYLLEIGFSKIVDAYEDGDTEEALHLMASTLQGVNSDVTRSRVTDITQTGRARLERYIAYTKRNGSLKGIPTGFDCLDQITLGWQPGQLITFVGPEKSGKSTMLLLSMMAAHKAVYTPLFIGFEMTNEEQEERHDAIRAGVNHQDLRAGTLSKSDMDRIKGMMTRNVSMPPLIFSEDANSTLTVSGVAAQIDRYKPDVTFIDGVYMMEDESGQPKGTPQAITNITRSIKQLGKNLRTPIVISTQVLRNKMTKGKIVTPLSVGYSSSFGQDSDEMIGVEQTDDPQINKVKSMLGRNHAPMEQYMFWDWTCGKFEEIEDPTGGGEHEGPVTF